MLTDVCRFSSRRRLSASGHHAPDSKAAARPFNLHTLLTCLGAIPMPVPLAFLGARRRCDGYRRRLHDDRAAVFGLPEIESWPKPALGIRPTTRMHSVS